MVHWRTDSSSFWNHFVSSSENCPFLKWWLNVLQKVLLVWLWSEELQMVPQVSFHFYSVPRECFSMMYALYNVTSFIIKFRIDWSMCYCSPTINCIYTNFLKPMPSGHEQHTTIHHPPEEHLSHHTFHPPNQTKLWAYIFLIPIHPCHY